MLDRFGLAVDLLDSRARNSPRSISRAGTQQARIQHRPEREKADPGRRKRPAQAAHVRSPASFHHVAESAHRVDQTSRRRGHRPSTATGAPRRRSVVSLSKFMSQTCPRSTSRLALRLGAAARARAAHTPSRSNRFSVCAAFHAVAQQAHLRSAARARRSPRSWGDGLQRSYPRENSENANRLDQIVVRPRSRPRTRSSTRSQAVRQTAQGFVR